MSSLILLRLYYFVSFGALGLYLPFFPPWLKARGFHGVQLSLLSLLIPLLSVIAPPVVGGLADKFALRGRMISFVAAASAGALSVLTVGAASLAPLPFGFTMGAVFVFATFRSSMIGLADVLALEHPTDYGRIRLWGSLGFLVAAFTGGQLLDPSHPYWLPLFVSVSLWGSVFVAGTLPQVASARPRPALADAHALLNSPGFALYLAAVALIFSANSAYDFCMSLRLLELGASPGFVGAFWALATASEIILMQFSSKWLRRFGQIQLLTAAAFLAAGRWLLIGVSTSLTLLIALQPLHAVTFGLLWISALGTLKQKAHGRGMATAQGLFTAAVGTGASAGMACWGTLYERFGSGSVFLAASAVGLLGAITACALLWTAGDAPPVVPGPVEGK